MCLVNKQLSYYISLSFKFQVSYCNTACRDLAWEQYHQVLCTSSLYGETKHPLDQLQEAWRLHYL